MSNSNRRNKSYRFSKVFKSKEQLIEFPCFSLLGGNRKDPLNLNELIRKKNQSTIHHHQVEINGNDRPIEILLQPNIFDPLCLDISSSSSHQIDVQQVPQWR